MQARTDLGQAPLRRWVPVRDATGRTRMEMRWSVPEHGQPVASLAAGPALRAGQAGGTPAHAA